VDLVEKDSILVEFFYRLCAVGHHSHLNTLFYRISLKRLVVRPVPWFWTDGTGKQKSRLILKKNNKRKVTTPRDKSRGFTPRAVLGLDNHQAMLVVVADF